MAQDWIDAVSEGEWDTAIDRVIREQRKHGVYSGSRLENCERCDHVKRDSTYPNGSPTGLVCSAKSVFVSANAKCDEFDR